MAWGASKLIVADGGETDKKSYPRRSLLVARDEDGFPVGPVVVESGDVQAEDKGHCCSFGKELAMARILRILGPDSGLGDQEGTRPRGW